MDDWRDGYRAALAEFIKQRGLFVEDSHYPLHDWGMDEPDPTDYDERHTTYSWADYAHKHDDRAYGGSAPCHVVSVDMTTLRERSLSRFEGTFTSNKNEVGVEVRATCACGKYTDKWLRWAGTVGDILPALLEER